MPIKIMLTERGAGPVVICDYCNKRIEDAREANYEWDGEVHRPGELLEVAFLHKNCAWERQRRTARLFDSMEMIDLVPYLADNLHLDWETARKHAQTMSEDIG